MSDAFGLVCEEGVTIAPSELLERAGLSAFEVHHLHATQREFGLDAQEEEPGLAITLTKDWETFWADRKEQNKKFVQKTERRQRNVEKECGPLSIQFDPDNARDLLEELIEKKRAQYARTGVRDALREDWKREMLFKLFETKRDTCRGMISVLYAGDDWVATHFGLVSGDVLHYWFPVYNTELSKHSPGHLLIKATLERAAELGIRTIDRGAGDTSAKRSFATDEQSFLRGEWSRPGVRSSLHRVLRSVRWRLEGLKR